MSDDMVFFLVLLAIAAVFIYAVRRAGLVPQRHRDAMLAGAAGDSSAMMDGGHHGGACDGGACDGGGHSGGGDAGSCDGGGGGHG